MLMKRGELCMAIVMCMIRISCKLRKDLEPTQQQKQLQIQQKQ